MLRIQFIRTFCVCACLCTLIACQNINPSSPITAVGGDSAEHENPSTRTIDSRGKVEEINNPAGLSTQNLAIADPVYDNLWRRLEGGFQLTEFYDHPEVRKQLEAYRGKQRLFDLVTERASPFLYWIIEEIDRRQLPLELALIPIVESTFNPNAYSAEHAVGLWQFVGATAKSFGLQRDWWYDARRDPRASTVAALDYLEALQQQFDGNWLLSLAAYNTGEGNVRRAIRRSGQSGAVDFWSLPLARETRSHVPKILALAKLISDSESYSIVLTKIANQEPLEVVEIGAQIDIAQAAKLAQLDTAHLRNLNPGYLQWATHPDQPQRLALPRENAELLRTGLSTLPAHELVSWDRYQILPGDSLSKIAHQLATRVDILQAVNQLHGSRIVAGESLLIPRTSDDNLLHFLSLNAPAIRQSQFRSIAVPVSYRVRGGDNLWRIARRYDLKSIDIAAWNGIELTAVLRPGQVLRLQPPGANNSERRESIVSENQSIYQVRRGDSLARIANRFQVKLEDLLIWNNMRINELIHPGQEIAIIAPESGLN